MYKSMIIPLLLSAIMLIGGCTTQATPAHDASLEYDESIQELPIYEIGEPMYAYAVENVPTLEDKANLIVCGYLKNDAHEVSGEHDTATVSSLVITKVFKGDVKKGDIINLGEGYYIGDIDGQKAIITTEKSYVPSVPGVEYVWFLGQHTDPDSPWYGVYAPVFGIKGRYRVESVSSADSLEKNDMSAIVLKKDSGYPGFYSEIVEKYME